MKVRCTGLATRSSPPWRNPGGHAHGGDRRRPSRGVVDASMAPQESLATWKWGRGGEVHDGGFRVSYSTGMFVVMNKDKWKSLPADIQKIIEKLNEEWIESRVKDAVM